MRAFISYSHRDSGALERLHVHLANLQREGRIEAWYDREILAGDALDEEINKELNSADLFLLMVSPDFIASEYCVEREMQRALERHDAGEARVVPIIVEPCDWAGIPQLRKLKALPKDGLPISEWTNKNTAYLDIVQELRRIVDAGGAVMREHANEAIAPAQPQRGVPRFRIQRDFDEIDRSEYRDAAFATIRDYFRRAIGELDEIEGLRGRFVDRSEYSFGGTVVNRGLQNGTAHITVYRRSGRLMLADIYYSFDENAADNTANGGFNVSSDEYDQFLVKALEAIGNEPSRLNAEQAAEYLWNRFLEQAGITYA
ncbi:toll/interleukin-1 receptor domain-containing protein [Frigidibacter sp. ROC022]|uniref:toll/interleukin-1 receptor domain-containing protein n=1 Tax=Frigidibacter sp. ROC022 TaxID=2971796 RepID=UPI00215AD1F0|nr:toll/interleukin-1 receptor domain-containing protein [Frigidibacter sp. ROC022]MCR8724074.1 toll/interleukin-1 receptor domain-containing protein [Frigidibacter sp. ROC022]